MASISRHKNGWRAQVARQGVRRSKIFPTKQEARDWAARQEHLILNGARMAAAQPFADVLERYAREVSPGKRGERWERIRLAKLARDDLGKVSLRDLTATHLAAWRDRRLREVAPGSVAREMTLLSSVLSVACKEWQIIPHNPLADVRKPPAPPARDRLPTPDEIERMRHVAGEDLTTATARAMHAFLFACETAMRAGEIVGLRPGDVDGNVARLRMTKNGRGREVPLSSAALALLEALPPADPLFGLSSRQLDSLFRKVRDRAAVADLVFHDSRHLAITNLSRRVDVLTLARMVGHRDLKMLMTYYNESASDIAGRLG